MLNSIAMIAVGGALGSVARHYTNIGVMALVRVPFPWGTFTANVLGCFLMGALTALFVSKLNLSPEWRLFLTTGFLGGYTTFSTFALDAVTLSTRGDMAGAITYILGSVILSIAAVILGTFLVWRWVA